MKLELYRDGELYMSIESTSGDVDFTILPKSIVLNSSLSPKSFDDLFLKCTKDMGTYVEAYNKAEQIHQDFFGVKKYSDYDSFRISKSNRIKR